MAAEFKDVFRDELTQRVRPGLDAADATEEKAYDLGLAGLALSGGGIRSATFNLGLLQSLGNNGILQRCDYLSTVSGGGYIGSCLTSLCSEPDADVTPARFPFRYQPGHERREIKHIRLHGKFLALSPGLFRAHTWRLISTFLGGLFITLLTATAMLAAVSAGAMIALQKLVAADVLDVPGAYEGWLFAPALAVLGLWALGGLGYVAASIGLTPWTIGFRTKLRTAQGYALMVAGLLAVAGGLPFAMLAVHTVRDAGAEAFTSSAGVSALSFLLSRMKFKEALKRLLFMIGGWTLVVTLMTAVIYSVWTWRHEGPEALPWIMNGSFVLLGLLAFCVDINRVSMFYFYRDRLSEAFIFKRRGDEIVPNDDLKLKDVPTARPYHLINAAVNLANSENLKMRGRKADFFLQSPLYFGSSVTGYAKTSEYESGRVSLASAMAVSGAATNPQYGRGTNPAFAFLMALLNVRLGVWAQNPRFAGKRAKALRQADRYWPWYLIKELLRLSDEEGRYINLSDGGHIENLGVYELLRRRCRYIIASDAGADPDCTFGDLGNLIRMARIDLGVHIRNLVVAPLKPGLDGTSEAHAIVGEIHYPEGTYGPRIGTLVYVKSALTCDDVQDLHDYKRRHPSFPHESTTDQFFGEEQVESYRELGYLSGNAVRKIIEERKLFSLQAR